jgi:hypothetical protein
MALLLTLQILRGAISLEEYKIHYLGSIIALTCLFYIYYK